MSAIITDKFRISNAVAFKTQFASGHYMFIGQSMPWNDDSTPPLPTDDVATHASVWNNMLGAKAMSAANIRLSVRRIDWEDGVVYDPYDTSDPNLFLKDFYVITDENKVYKCIGNNAGNPTTPSGKPTNTGSAIFTTADGYKWKYMFTVSPVDATGFLTPQHIPVPDGTGVNQDVNDVTGSISSYKVTNIGSNYSSPPTVAITGDGTGATATAVLDGTTVSSITVTDPGSGYTHATVTLSGGGGNGATATANISPEGGHGNNPKEELGAYYVTINGKFSYGEGGDITTANDFRVVGIIKDPKNSAGTAAFTDPTARTTWRLTMDADPATTTADAELTFDTTGDPATANIVSYDSGNKYLYVTNASGPISLATGISGDANVTTIDPPEMKPSTGSILFLDNRTPTHRATNQVEDFKITLEW